MATSEAQKKASAKYRKENKDKLRIGRYRRTAKMFIKSHATADDLTEFNELIEQREKELNKNNPS